MRYLNTDLVKLKSLFLKLRETKVQMPYQITAPRGQIKSGF